MSNKKMTVSGIEYTLPTVTLLNESGLGVAELAARTCYDSFENSENECIREFEKDNQSGATNLEVINNIEDSKLLDDLAWTYFHHSILEHTTLQFLIKGTSRGVLQEHARHRMQNISVRSTRYTMSNVIYSFIACNRCGNDSVVFYNLINSMDMFVTSDPKYNALEIMNIWNKLSYQLTLLGNEDFLKKSLSKENLNTYWVDDYSKEDPTELLGKLMNGTKKRNVGDNFKHIVSDNWKVDMVVSMNLRALKNYFDLRDSGAAYFQIQWLAKEMKNTTPVKYLKLIDKKFKK